MHFIAFLLLLFLCHSSARAQSDVGGTLPEIEEQILVHSSKRDTPAAELQGLILITRQEIEARQWQSLAQVLEAQPGFASSQAGGAGQLSRFYVRGSASDNVLFLLDGVKLNDPADIGRGFDASHISTAGLERIEIALGPQSALYGSEASAAVINLVSREQGAGRPRLDAELGEQSSRRLLLTAGTTSGNWHLNGHLQGNESDGLSASDDPMQQTLETDAVRHLQAGLGLHGEPHPGQTLQVGAFHGQGELDLDGFGGPFGDDANFKGENELSTLRASWSRLSSRWTTRVLTHWSRTRRKYHNPADFGDTSLVDSEHYSGEQGELEWRNRWVLGSGLDLLAGLELEREEATISSLFHYSGSEFHSAFSGNARTFGSFLNMAWTGRRSALSGGVRHDDSNRYPSSTTYQASYRLQLGKTRLQAELGSGTRLPSLYQSFSSYGNLELQPEHSRSYQLHLSRQWSAVWRSDLTLHRSNYRDLIVFFTDPATYLSRYQNEETARMSGAEFSLSHKGPRLSWRLFLEQLATEDHQGEDLVRRPRDRAGLQLDLVRAGWQASMQWIYSGEREDLSFDMVNYQTVRVHLDARHDLRLAAAWQIDERWQLRARVENVLDHHEPTIFGYSVPGRSAHLGVGCQF
jgi:vitamin B12 transporter